MQSQFPDWLSLATRDGRGGASGEPPAISRGRAYATKFNFAAHPDFGDWTAGSFSMVARAAPDAGGSPLATFTCTRGTPSGAVTPVTVTLAPAAQSGLPADGNGDGWAEVFFELVYTLAGVPTVLVSSRLLVTGAV